MNLLKNIQIRILAVLSALLLWMFVVGVENYVFLLPSEVQVKVTNLSQNVSVAKELSKVKIRYRKQDEAGTISPAEFEVSVDAQNLTEGEYNLPISALSKNPKVSVVAVEPATLNLKLEANTSKEIAVEAVVTGSPDKDFELKVVKLSNEKVKVSGASSLLSSLKSLPIKVNLDGSENADFSRKVTLEAPMEWNLNGKTVSFDPAVIQMEIEIRRKKPLVTVDSSTGSIPLKDEIKTDLKRKSLMVEIVKEGTLSTSVKELLPTNVLVTVEGLPADIDGLGNSSLKLNLDPSRVVSGSYMVNPEDIVIPTGKDIKIVEYSPEKVLVKY